MVNSLRLLLIFLTSRFSSRRPLEEVSSISLRVWPNDLDLNLHMNNGRYLSLMDLGRVDLMFRCGLGQWLKRGWQPLVGASFCRHFKPLNLFQEFAIDSRVLGWDEKWLYIEHRVRRGADLHALAVIKALVAERGAILPTRDLLAAIGHESLESPALPGWVQDWLKSERSAITHLKSERAAGRADGEAGRPA